MKAVFAPATLEEARRLLARLERMSVDSAWARRASGTRGGLIKLIEEIEAAGGVTAPEVQGRLDTTVERAYDLLIRAAREMRGRSAPASTPTVPYPRCYWVEPGHLLAGVYPGAPTTGEARPKLQAFIDAGVTLFIDLTEEGEQELKPYAPLLAGRARHIRRPIPDLGVPNAADLRLTLDILERALALGECVYVHCWGGRGRTGTVIGTYLVRRGLSGPQALEHIHSLRGGLPAYDRSFASPETAEQQALVRTWREDF